MSNSANQSHSRQREIRDWFDQTYARQGLAYLRPVQAYEVFLTLLEAKPGKSLLDVACGPGQMLVVASEAGLQVSGIDLAPTAIEMCRKRLPEADTREANAEDIPFEADCFDFVTCLGSLERMLNREQVLAEIRRVLRPGGRACFLVRNARHPLWRLLGLFGMRNHQGHQDAAPVTDWSALFARAGFRTIDILPDQWPLMLSARLRHRLGGNPSFDRPRRGLRPLNWAYEFIFLLEHDSD
jgi:SAM-dependent methyltransferase